MSLVQQIINGLALGSVYALIAIGYTMVYGIIGLINFAHGDVYMVGAYSAFLTSTYFHIPFIPSLIIAMIVCAILGFLIDRIAYKPLRKSPKITLFITAIGMSILLENGFRVIFGPDPKPFPQLFKVQNYTIGSVQINTLQIIMLAVSILLVVILQFVIYRTKIGKAMRATSFDSDAAQLMGINIDFIISFTFAIGSALAAAAGVLVGMAYPRIDPYMGMMPGMKAFIAAVLGGIGLMPGALVGGIIMGLLETMTKAYVSTKLSDAIAFGLLIIILLVKPAGILGKKSREKV